MPAEIKGTAMPVLEVTLQSMPLSALAHGLQPYLARQDAPQAPEAGAIGGIIGNIMRGQ